MKTCPYCLEDVNEKALRCPHCSSWFETASSEQMTSGQKVVYIVDKDLIRFSKFAISILAIFLVVGAFFYGFNLEEAAGEINNMRDDIVAVNAETQQFKEALDDDKNNIAQTEVEVQKILEEARTLKQSLDIDKEQINQTKLEVSRTHSETITYRDAILNYQKEAAVIVSSLPERSITENDVRLIIGKILVESGALDEAQLATLVDTTGSITVTLDTILDQRALEIIQAKQAIEAVQDGVPVKVAVVADGVSTTAPQLQDQLLEGRAFGGIVPNSGPNHFMGVVSLIAAIAPEAKILPLQVLNVDGAGNFSNILAGLEYALDQDVRIIVLPLGGDFDNEAYDLVVEKAQEKDILIFAAAGIRYGDEIVKNYPAATSGVLAVTSTDNEDKIWSSANYGDWITLAAPGVGITTLNNEGFLVNTIQGPSASVAIAGGVAALTLSANPDLTANELEAILTLTAKDVSGLEFDIGRIDALAAVQAATEGR